MMNTGVSGVQFGDENGWRAQGLHLTAFDSRFRGWLFRAPSANVRALLLSPCNAVHFLGTAFSLDVLFLDRTGGVLEHQRCKRPGAFPSRYARAWGVLEIPSAFCAPDWAPQRILWNTMQG
jgi:hypothetical protein